MIIDICNFLNIEKNYFMLFFHLKIRIFIASKNKK